MVAASNDEGALPSWVPNFEQKQTGFVLHLFNESVDFRAGLEGRLDVRFDSDSKVIVLKGVYVAVAVETRLIEDKPD